ncbi:pyridoxal phosphate-dependent aminotransferase [Pelobacter seleniigenes]|uniref:pyridoxal phosphate-dependent aminotransferase n=1 Tax=Pelobacter seleniigenes TaxID=407188 RepID=UPI0004A6FD08|nr:pyridoxal phosphate-dependent aminotransferase [Pelobacter seleniigenes]
MQIADRMAEIRFSGIRKILEQVNLLEKQGRHIIRLEIGRPDFDTPQHIKDAAIQALNNGQVHYSSNYGISQLSEAICNKLETENRVTYAPQEVIVTAGANEAVFIAMMALLNPGDEVLIPDPCWVAYHPCATMAGATPVSVPLHFAKGFVPQVEDIAAQITPKTRMLVINTPQNPTGVVYGPETLQKLAQLAVEHNLYVLSDEIYERIIYDGARHVSIATFPGMRERTVIINGMSKIFSMTGWRLGYAAADRPLTDAMIRIHQNTMACATSFAQWGGVAALNGPQQPAEEMVAEFKRRRNFLYQALQEMPGVRPVHPSGAFYLFVNIEELGRSSEEVAMHLLEKAGVAVVPGSSFGRFGEGCLRISYANSYENLEIAVDRMSRALRELN